MIVYSIKLPSESNEKLILRYKKMFYQTRSASKLKAERQHHSAPSKRKIREKAIVRGIYRGFSGKHA